MSKIKPNYMRKLLLLRSYWLTAFHTSGANSSSYLS